MQLTGLLDGLFTDILPLLISALLLVLVYFQYRVQKKEYQPDLDVPRVAHHLSVVKERDSSRKKSDVEPDEVLFEVSNLGSGTASWVHVDSKIRVLYRGDEFMSGNNSPSAADGENADTEADRKDDDESAPTNIAEPFCNLPFLQSSSAPRVLSLDVFREDVYYSNWEGNAEATIPSGRSDIGYLIHLHVRKPDGQESLNEILAEEYPEKTVFRLQLILVYAGPLSTYDYTDQILDLVIYPGICSTLQEAMEVGIPYSRYTAMDREQAILNAHVDFEEFETSISEE